MARSLDWRDFRPSRLVAARETVVEQHPSSSTGLRAASGSELASLRERIEAAKGAPAELEAVARQLTLSQVRGLAVQIGPWEDLRGPISTILRLRRKASLIPHLWRTWQRYPRPAAIRELLRELVKAYGWGGVADGYETSIEEWTKSGTPAVAIQSWLDGQGLSYSDMIALADLPLDQDAALVRMVRDAVMTRGSASQLLSEGADRLIEWFPELDVGDRQLFGRNYLVSVDVNCWDAQVLDLLYRAYGAPRSGRSAFWKEVPEDRRAAFQRWHIERNLEEALGSDTARHRYWMRWSDELVDVDLGKAGQVEYAVLFFETFGVVEFFQKPNAAYFYERSRLKEIRKRSVTHPSDLKDQRRAEFGPWGDNRLIHSKRWQRRADRMVSSWKRGTRR